MIDDDGGGSPLRLRAFTRIVDNKGIEMRHRTEDRFRKAVFRQCNGFAWQPLEITVFAEMDHRMGVIGFPQPGIEGDIAMRRDQVGIVIAFRRVDVVTARRLDRDHDIAEFEDREQKIGADDEGVGRGGAPTLAYLVAHAFR